MDYYEKMVQELSVNIVTIAYRGFSDSDGHPTEKGLKKDGLRIMQWINNNKNLVVSTEGEIFLTAHSLGGAVATWVATHEETPTNLFSGLILENTFTSISDMFDQVVPSFLHILKPVLLDVNWNSIDLI